MLKPDRNSTRDLQYMGSVEITANSSDNECINFYPYNGAGYYPRCEVCNDIGLGNQGGQLAFNWCGNDSDIVGYPDTISCADAYWCDDDNAVYSDNTMLLFSQCCAVHFGGSYLDYTIELSEQGVGTCGSSWKAEGWDCYLDTSNLISGCNDSAACNYDPTAQIGDGSCYYGDCITDWAFTGEPSHQNHLISLPFWVDYDPETFDGSNPTWGEFFGPLCDDAGSETGHCSASTGFCAMVGEGAALICHNNFAYGWSQRTLDPFKGFWLVTAPDIGFD